MNEIPFYFTNGNYQLFGILYRPENKVKDLGFVFVHPFAEEKLWTQRVYVNFARELAQQGYPVLRFDVMGHGDSEGDFEDSTIETRLSDINCAIDQLMTDVPEVKQIALLGIRFGGTLAALAAEKRSEVKKLLLWEPIIDGEKYMQELLRINLTTQTAVYKKVINDRDTLIQQMKEGKTVNIDGYEMTFDLYQQACDINLNQMEKKFSGTCFISQISKTAKNLKGDMELLANSYKNCTTRITPEFPFWKEIKVFYSKAPQLFDNTLEWLENGQ